MARRGENIRKRSDGRWEGRYIKGRSADGKPCWGYVYGATYTEVREISARKKAEYGIYNLNSTDYDQFNTGKRIQKLRRERYLTQEELAVRLNVSDRHLRSLESGEYIPSIDLFIEIAAFFDVTLDHLIMGKSLSDQEESLRNKLQQKRLTNQKLRLKLQRIMQKLSAIAEEL